MKRILLIGFCCCLLACALAQVVQRTNADVTTPQITERQVITPQVTFPKEPPPKAKSVNAAPRTVTPQAVSYVRSLPEFAGRAVPKAGKSVFWGELVATPRAAPVGLHLYALDASELKEDSQNTSSARCRLILDVFSLSSQPKRLNRIPLVYKFTWVPTHFGISFTWVNQKAKSVPMLIVRDFSKGIYGPLGIEHFVAFPGGLEKPAGINNLYFGAWRASDTGGETNTLALRPDGWLEIRAFLSPTTSELTAEQVMRDYTFTLSWDKDLQKFVPHSENKALAERYSY